MPDLTPEQQAIFDAEIESLRERLDWRKAIMALPSLKQCAAALKSLRVAVSSVRRASRSKALQTAGLFSYQTEQWLDDAQAVADELRKLTKPPRNPVLARGMTRPNEYRAWLIGERIPALFARIFDGAALPVTVAGEAKGKRGIEFVRRVLDALGEASAKDETIKSFVGAARYKAKTGKARNKVRTRKTRT
jgi:hypothetical protein